MVCIVGALLVLVYFLRLVLIPFVVSAALAYIFAPAVRATHRALGIRRWAAALLVYLLLIGVIGLAAWRAGSLAYNAISHIVAGGPEEFNRMAARLFGGGDFVVFGHHFQSQQIASDMSGKVQAILNAREGAMLAGSGVSVVCGLVLFLVLLFYFFISGPQLAVGMLRLAPPECRPALSAFGASVNPVLQRYLRGLCVIVVYSGCGAWVGVNFIFHLPHAFFLGLATGLLELIPILGPTISATMVGAAIALHGGTIWTFAGYGLFWFCLRMSIDQVVGPLVLGQAIHAHPVAIIFAFVAGGTLFGLLGVLLAIPTVAVVRIMLDTYYALPVEE